MDLALASLDFRLTPPSQRAAATLAEATRGWKPEAQHQRACYITLSPRHSQKERHGLRPLAHRRGIRTEVKHLFIGCKPVELTNKHTVLYEKFSKQP